MKRIATITALLIVLGLFASFALVGTNVQGHHKPGHKGGGDTDNGDDNDNGASLPFQLKVTKLWKTDGYSPTDLNDYGDVVVSLDIADDFTTGRPILHLSDEDPEIDINKMTAKQFADNELDVDPELFTEIDGEKVLRPLVNAEAVNNYGQIAGQYPIDALDSQGFPQWRAYRYTPPYWGEDEEGEPILTDRGRLENLISDDAVADDVTTTSITDFNDNGDVLIRAGGGLLLYLDGHRLIFPDELREAAGGDFTTFALWSMNNRVVDEDGQIQIQMAGEFGRDGTPLGFKYTFTYEWDPDNPGASESINGELLLVKLAGHEPPGMRGNGINNRGDVVGYGYGMKGKNSSLGFLYKDGDEQAQELDFRLPTRINDFGDIIGRTGSGGQSILHTGETTYLLHDLIDLDELRDLIIDEDEQLDSIDGVSVRSLQINSNKNGPHPQIVARVNILTDDGWVNYGRVLLTLQSVDEE